MAKKTGAKILLETLANNKIKYITGYIGGAIMPVFDLLGEFNKNISFVMSRNEQGAGFIAIGYYKASRKLMPVLTTSGPGATNTVTAIADAMMDSSAILLITGQVSTKVIGSDAFQESDIVGLMYPITKQAKLVTETKALKRELENLMYISTTNRPGPVCLDLPKNIQTEEIEEEELLPNKVLKGFKKLEARLQIQDIEKFLDMICKSTKPVILSGHGVIVSGCYKELQNFVDYTKIPVSNTLHGLSGFKSNSKYFLGMMGMHGEIEANKAIENSDLIIAFGMRFDDRVTGKLDEFAKNAKVIHIDIDEAELDKNVKADLKIHANLMDFLRTVNELLIKRNYKFNRLSWLKEIDSYKKLTKKNYEDIYSKGVGEDGKLLMSRIVHELSEFTRGKDNIVTDVGQHQMFSAKHYKFNKYNSWFTSGGAGTMGAGLPMAIGVKLAKLEERESAISLKNKSEEEVWCITGDGGIQMNIQELGTIMQYELNINILLFNNSFLGMVKQWQNLFFKDNYAQTELINPNFEAICNAYGVKYRKVEKVEDIRKALEWSRNEKTCTFVEFICDKTENVFPMIPPNHPFDKIVYNKTHAKEVLGL